MRGPLIATVVIALIGGVTGYLYWQKLEAARLSAEATRAAAAASQNKVVEARALCGRARAALLEAIDNHLLPSAEETIAAADLYAQAAALDGASVEASSGVALAEAMDLARQGRLDEAATRMEAATDGEPQLGGYLHGWIQFSRQQPTEAWGEFGQVLKEHDDWMPARFYRAAADATLDSSEDHYDELSQAVQRWPGNPDVIAGMGRALERKHGNKDAGLAWLVRAVELGSTDAYVVERVVWNYLDSNEAEKARDLLVSRVEREPYRVDLRLLLARAHEHLGEYEPAEQQLAAIIASVPDDRFLRLTMAIHYLNRGDGPNAAASLEAAKELPAEEGLNIGYIGGETLLKNPDQAKQLLASSCQGGSTESCVEACALGERKSCASVPGYHDPNRRASAVSVIGHETDDSYSRGRGRPSTTSRDRWGQVVTSDGTNVTYSSRGRSSGSTASTSGNSAQSYYRGNYLPRSTYQRDTTRRSASGR